MMKVLKVIVDTLPESCWQCFLKNINCRVCHLNRRYIEDYDARPDWCPLELESKVKCGGDMVW